MRMRWKRPAYCYKFSRLGSTINVTAHPGGKILVSALQAPCIFCDFKERTNVYKGDAGGAGGYLRGFSAAGKEESW